MSLTILGKTIEKIGVIGSGQIGPDIALHFAKVFHGSDVEVVVVDIAQEALARGRKKLDRKVDKGVESGAFKPAMGQAMKEGVSFTTDYDALSGASMIVEAATEDRDLKSRIFQQVEKLVDADTILASNSSHLEPERIFAEIGDRSRTLVIHYFFPAERNPIVEIVPGAETKPELTQGLMGFYESIGKVPIEVGSRYGYALDPLFEGQFLAAALLAETGKATTKEIDWVAREALGLTVGPFTAMNLTGGNPITHHGLQQYTISPWFRSPKILADMVESGDAWDVPARGESVEVDADKTKWITERLRGAVFGIVGECVDSKISNVADLDMSVEIALDMAPPFRRMNEIGVKESLRLVEQYASENPGFPVPKCLKDQAATGEPWTIPTVLRRDVDGVAVITVRRPKVLNALNRDAFDQIRNHFEAIRDDASVKAAVVTGFGVKAFVSGADVGFLSKIDSAEMGEATSWHSNEALLAVENCGKPVVAAMNGIAYGGGNELAMACTARLAKAGLRGFIAQPEPNLGIMPGAGGTQRLPRWIGAERAAEMLRTGRPISSAEAKEFGLVRTLVDGDVVAAAIDLARRAGNGDVELDSIPASAQPDPGELPKGDIGHRSTAVDARIERAIREGLTKSLEDGLRLESHLFGEICTLEDMRIGVTNFLENGPRSEAKFAHR